MDADALPTTRLEEAWGDWVDRTEFLTDDPSFSAGGLRAIYATSLDDRKDGSFRPVYETEQDLAESRAAARNLVLLTGVRTGVLDALANYTLGQGFAFEAAAENDTVRQDRILSEVVQKIIDRFIDENDFNGLIDREIHQRSREDGEAIVAFDEAEIEAGRVLVEFLEPDQLVQPANPSQLEDWLEIGNASCWKFGVHTQINKTWKPLGYHIVRDGRGADWDYYPANRVEHVKRNVTRSAKRGVTDFYEVVNDLKREAKLRGNAVQGGALQAAIAWITQVVPGTTTSQATSMTATDRVGQYNRPAIATGGVAKTQNVNHFPMGTVLKVPAGQEYKPGPMGSERNAGFELIGQYALRAIGVRWNMPEYMVSGDASNANYASALVAESPFVKAREADQQFYKRHFLSLLWKVIRIHVESGRFERYGIGRDQYDDLMQMVRIECECPTVASRDPKVAVDSDKVLVDGGIMSKQTWAARNNLDYEQEQKLGAKDAPPPPSPFGGPGGSPFGQQRQPGQEPQMPGQAQQQVPPAEEPQEAFGEGIFENCGTGAGGFQPGNDCARGGDSFDTGNFEPYSETAQFVKSAMSEREYLELEAFRLIEQEANSKPYRPLTDSQKQSLVTSKYIKATKKTKLTDAGRKRYTELRNKYHYAEREDIRQEALLAGIPVRESTLHSAVTAALESVETTDEARAILNQLVESYQ